MNVPNTSLLQKILLGLIVFNLGDTDEAYREEYNSAQLGLTCVLLLSN
jgi:hypothetical protein